MINDSQTDMTKQTNKQKTTFTTNVTPQFNITVFF